LNNRDQFQFELSGLQLIHFWQELLAAEVVVAAATVADWAAADWAVVG
jgi:hypothetical protein